MPSILRCCYVSGAHRKAREKKCRRLLDWMTKAGMMEVVKPATEGHDPLGLLRFCSEQTGLGRGRLEWEQIATRLLRLLRSIQEASAECLDDLLVSDLVVALASDRWQGLDPVVAIRFADKFKGRLVELILEQLEIRQAAAARELQKQRECDPEYRFQQALNRGSEFRSECSCDSYDALLHLIWHTLPQHRHLFRDRYRNGLVFDVPKPSEFLTEQEKQELYPLWLSVVQSRDADAALQAIIDKHPITNQP